MSSNTRLSIIRSGRSYSQEWTPRIVTEPVRLEEPQVQDTVAAREIQEKGQDVNRSPV